MVTSNFKTMALSELIEDMDIYPRHSIDSTHVQKLTMALETGANLPPIAADAKSKRITDGWHRARAYRRFLGPEATVDVELVNYRNIAEMLVDAVQRNATHGRRLDRMDETRAIVMLEREGVSIDKIAIALHVPEARVEKLRVKVAQSKHGHTVPGTSTITLKRPVQHMQGKNLTRQQTEVHQILPGTSFLLIAKQLSRALGAGMVDLSDERLVAQLVELQAALTKALPA